MPIQYFSSGINYDGGLPEGPITLTVGSYRVRSEGPWVVEWTPGIVSSTEETPGTQPEVPCISESDWTSALANPQPIPADLNRRMIFMDYNAKTSIPSTIICPFGRQRNSPLDRRTDKTLLSHRMAAGWFMWARMVFHVLQLEHRRQ